MSTNNAINNGFQKVTQFTSTGIWTKDSRTTSITVIGIHGGAGGNSGARNVSGASTGGTGGAASGGFYYFNMPAANFGTTETVTVGLGGTGGTPVLTDNTAGNAAGSPTTSAFGRITGPYSRLVRGPIAYQPYQDNPPGGLGSLTNGVAPAKNWELIIGGASLQRFYPSYDFAPGCGGGGGAGANSITEHSGANGQACNYVSGGIGGLESTSINGGNGADWDYATCGGFIAGGGAGGGGGGQSVGAVAGNGGNGGFPGGSGGGGGGSLNGTNSGAGGNGSDGLVIVIEN
jgi:hypothetical protein